VRCCGRKFGRANLLVYRRSREFGTVIMGAMGPRPHRRSLALTGALLVLSGVLSGTAGAATYSVWACRGPDGAPLATEAWDRLEGGAATADSCEAGGSLSATFRRSDAAPGRARGFRFALPPGARIGGYRLHLHAVTAKAGGDEAFQAGADVDGAGDALDIDAGCPTPGCTFGVPETPLAAANVVAAESADRAGIAVAAICGRPRGCFDLLNDKPVAEVRLFRSEVLVRDDTPPVLESITGLPPEGASAPGGSLVDVTAADGGGGVAALALLVDGREVARREAGGTCREPFTRAAPCADRLTASFPLDPAAAGPGAHTIAVRAVDAAGNAATSAPRTLGAAPATPGAGVSGISVERLVQLVTAPRQDVRLSVARSVISLSVSGRRGRISGTVRSTAGRPLPGVRVAMRSRPFGVRRVRSRLERTLTTDAQGRFSAAATGRSRIVSLEVDDAAHRAAEPVEVRLMQRLRVQTRSVERTLRNGSTLMLGANIVGAGSGAAGKALLVQALLDGRWTTVDSLTADGAGRARWRYRFRATTRPTVYRFRVKVERAGDVWPWPTTTSSPIRVLVAP
jgi:hypothetical protein